MSENQPVKTDTGSSPVSLKERSVFLKECRVFFFVQPLVGNARNGTLRASRSEQYAFCGENSACSAEESGASQWGHCVLRVGSSARFYGENSACSAEDSGASQWGHCVLREVSSTRFTERTARALRKIPGLHNGNIACFA